MWIKEEDWEEVANFKKNELGHCELCGADHEPTNLRARHLRYAKEVEDKYMLIVCQDCNHRINKAEKKEIELLSKLNSEVYTLAIHIEADEYYEGKKLTDIMRILKEYQTKRSDIITDAIVEAVKLNRTRKRPVIDVLFRHPVVNYDHELQKLCEEYGVWNYNLDSQNAKKKFEELRQMAKADKQK